MTVALRDGALGNRAVGGGGGLSQIAFEQVISAAANDYFKITTTPTTFTIGANQPLLNAYFTDPAKIVSAVLLVSGTIKNASTSVANGIQAGTFGMSVNGGGNVSFTDGAMAANDWVTNIDRDSRVKLAFDIKSELVANLTNIGTDNVQFKLISGDALATDLRAVFGLELFVLWKGVP